jgi:hypothetical protein
MGVNDQWDNDYLDTDNLRQYLRLSKLSDEPEWQEKYPNPNGYIQDDFANLPLTTASSVKYAEALQSFTSDSLEPAREDLLQAMVNEQISNAQRVALKEESISADVYSAQAQLQAAAEDLGEVVTPSDLEDLDALAAQIESDQTTEFQDELEALNETTQDQCLILSRLSFLESLYIKHLEASTDEESYPRNGKIIRLETENYAGVMSKLSGCEKAGELKNFTEKHLSAMVPKILFWKVIDIGGVEVDIPIKFEQNDKVGLDFLASNIHRGFGIGMENFEWSYEGTNPVTATKDVMANLTMKANSFNELLSERRQTIIVDGERETVTYKMIDLVLNPFTSSESDKEYKIKVELGWHKPTGATADLFSDLGDVNSLFDCLSETLYLIVVDHTIDVDDYGRITLGVEYRGYMEDTLESPKYNVLFPTAQLQEAFNKINEPFNEVSELCSKVDFDDNDSNDDLLDKFEEAQKVYEDSIETLRYAGFRQLITTIKERGRLFMGFVDEENLKNVTSMGEFRTLFSLGGKFNATALEDLEANITNLDDFLTSASGEDYLKELSEGTLDRFKFEVGAENPTERPIPFFFLGDLIDAAYDVAYKNPETPDLRIILPNFPFRTPGGTILSTSIAHIPISVEFFTEWFAFDAIGKELKYYPLMDFIRNITRTMISDVLGRQCPFGRVDFSVRFQPGFLKGEKKDGQEYFDSMANNNYVFNLDDGKLPTGFLSLGANTESTNVSNYFIVYPANTLYLQELAQDQPEIDRISRDENNGIVNFSAGSRSGFLRTLSFSKNDLPGLREARLERYGNVELSQLSNVYNANLNLYGMPGFYPGQRVFINPFALGLDVPTNRNSPAWSLGIGGYHIIVAVRSTIARGQYTTNIECRWESSDGQLQIFSYGDSDPTRAEVTDFTTLCREKLSNITSQMQQTISSLGTITTITEAPATSTTQTTSTSANTSVFPTSGGGRSS